MLRSEQTASTMSTHSSPFSDDRAVADPTEDRLDLEGFVGRLARACVAIPATSSLVIGLYGQWGQGKSSVLNLLAHRLKVAAMLEGERAHSTVAPIVVRFTPWLYRDVDDLLDSFFATLKRDVGGDIPASFSTRRKWNRALQGVESFLAAAKPMVGSATIASTSVGAVAAGGLGAILGINARALALVGAAFGLVLPFVSGVAKSALGGEQDFRRHRRRAEKVMEALAARGRPLRVVVLVDDLDRAESDEIAATLKLIKLVADLPNITYVVAMDHEKVAASLAGRNAGDSGAEFLEKIVQVVVHVPPVASSRMRTVLMDDLVAIATRAGLDAKPLAVTDSELALFENEYWKILSQRVKTLREKNRLTNAFQFTLAADDGHMELHAGDAALIAFLQVFYPSVYDVVRRERDWFLHEGPLDLGDYTNRNNREVRRSKREERLRAIAFTTETKRSERDLAIVLESLMRLFPNVTGDADELDTAAARRSHRIETSAGFDRYFRLSLDPNDVPQRFAKALVAWLKSPEERENHPSAVAEVYKSLSEPQRVRLTAQVRDQVDALDDVGLIEVTEGVPDVVGQVEPSHVVSVANSVLRASMTPKVHRGGFVEPDMDALAQLVLEIIRRLPPVDAAEFGNLHSHDQSRIVRFDQAERRAFAALAAKRLAEIFSEETDVLRDDLRAASRMLWEWNHLLVRSGEDPALPRGYVRRILRERSSALSDVLWLAAYTSDGGASIADRAWPDVVSALSAFVDVNELVERAHESVRIGSLESMRDPHLVEQFIELAEAQHGGES